MSFNHGTKHLTGQQQAIIRQNKATDKLLREEGKKKAKVAEAKRNSESDKETESNEVE